MKESPTNSSPLYPCITWCADSEDEENAKKRKKLPGDEDSDSELDSQEYSEEEEFYDEFDSN